MARTKKTEETPQDDAAEQYRAAKFSTLDREVEVKRSELAELEARRDRYKG